MKKIIIIIGLILIVITVNCQTKDKVFTTLVRFNHGIQFGDNTIQTTAAIGSGISTLTWSDVLEKPTAFTPSLHNQAWSTITGRPTTLAGYGITDAASTIHTHNLLYKSIEYVPTWDEILNKPLLSKVSTTGSIYDLVDFPGFMDLETALPGLDGICLPVLTNSEIASLVPLKGTILWNDTDNVLQIWTGTVWKIIISGN
jgi:hypothetical protein